MRIAYWTVPFACWMAAASASGQEGNRFVERSPLPRIPAEHTMSRAGNPQKVAPWASSGITRFQAGGYVGGGSLSGNRPLATGAGATAGAYGAGTFGWDFAGFHVRPGRIFLAASNSSNATPLARNYRTDGPHVPDPIAYRPLRRAILEKKEVMEERRGEKH